MPNEIFNKLLEQIPLAERLRNTFMLRDNLNWVNGEYTGNIKQIEEDVSYIMKDVKDRLKVICPNQIFDNL